jgi:uncharacterized protein
MKKHNKKLLISFIIMLSVWIVWYGYTFPNSQLILEKNWPITLTMIFGSFIAGATSSGGGAIAFPVFTKILSISALDAKIFSLAIQSVGMSAATLSIIIMRIPIEWRIVWWASLGGVFGVFLGSILIAELLPSNLIKMLFSMVIASFALTLAIVNWNKRFYNNSLPVFSIVEKSILVLSGFVGGVMTGLVGNGIDIICFSVMVLLFRLSEKVSTPTSVILMAINAIIGFSAHLFIVGGFSLQVESYWLAAIPVVVIGAPLGVYFCTKLNNKTIASMLICLISFELLSSILIIPQTSFIISISVFYFLLFSLIFHRLHLVTRYKPSQG